MFLRILAVLGCLWGNALGGYSQFFYTGLPLQQEYYQPPVPAYQPPVQAYQSHVSAYRPYIPPPVFYSPVQQYYTHPGFSFQHTAPAQPPVGLPPTSVAPQVQSETSSNDGVRVDEQNDSVEVNAEPVPVQRSETQTQPPPPLASRTFNFERKESNAFRGFAYHTEYDDGARSNVVFLTGPEIHNFQSPIQRSNTPASDALDSNALKEEAQPRRFEQNPSIRVLMDFLENPRAGVQKFYSVDNNLVARRLEDDYPTFPANTLPLAPPVSPIFSILRSNLNPETPRAAPQELSLEQRSLPEPLPLASEIKSNTVDPEPSTTTTETPSTTVAASTEPSSTTEAVSSTEASTTTETASSTTTTTTTTTEASTTSSSSMAPIVVE